jgi:hypothetical protein
MGAKRHEPGSLDAGPIQKGVIENDQSSLCMHGQYLPLAHG